MTDQRAAQVNPLYPANPTTADGPTITRTLVSAHYYDAAKKEWVEYGYTVTIGDTEAINRILGARK
jgi:hypothetical protein